MASDPRGTFPLRGKVVAAHPSRVAQADQLASAEKTKHVVLREHVPATHLYVLNLDTLCELPEEGFFRV